MFHPSPKSSGFSQPCIFMDFYRLMFFIKKFILSSLGLCLMLMVSACSNKNEPDTKRELVTDTIVTETDNSSDAIETEITAEMETGAKIETSVPVCPTCGKSTCIGASTGVCCGCSNGDESACSGDDCGCSDENSNDSCGCNETADNATDNSVCEDETCSSSSNGECSCNNGFPYTLEELFKISRNIDYNRQTDSFSENGKSYLTVAKDSLNIFLEQYILKDETGNIGIIVDPYEVDFFYEGDRTDYESKYIFDLKDYCDLFNYELEDVNNAINNGVFYNLYGHDKNRGTTEYEYLIDRMVSLVPIMIKVHVLLAQNPNEYTLDEWRYIVDDKMGDREKLTFVVDTTRKDESVIVTVSFIDPELDVSNDVDLKISYKEYEINEIESIEDYLNSLDPDKTRKLTITSEF